MGEIKRNKTNIYVRHSKYVNDVVIFDVTGGTFLNQQKYY